MGHDQETPTAHICLGSATVSDVGGIRGPGTNGERL
jgi:hypothetical protein